MICYDSVCCICIKFIKFNYMIIPKKHMSYDCFSFIVGYCYYHFKQINHYYFMTLFLGEYTFLYAGVFLKVCIALPKDTLYSFSYIFSYH